MRDFQSLKVNMLESQEASSQKEGNVMDRTPCLGYKRWKWWFLLAINSVFVLAGQAVATLLGNFYYDHGGNSKWMATLVQTIAFPILFIPRFLMTSHSPSSSPSPSPSGNLFSNNYATQISLVKLMLVYLFLGLLIAGDNMMYSVGLLYLPVSTYSLLCATQLAFNAVFSYFINAQKFTILIFNSVVILTLAAVLLAVTSDSSEPTGVSKANYTIGFICTLGASAAYALVLSLMQLSFQKVSKRETFSLVLDMQIYTSVVATCACIIGLFASGEWKGLKGEMYGFEKGTASYVMTLVGTAITWQICAVGVVGLVYVVSSLFSNVISTMSLPVIPILSVIILHDKVDGVKVVSFLMATWGCCTYLYQNYLDDLKTKAQAAESNINGGSHPSTLGENLVG